MSNEIPKAYDPQSVEERLYEWWDREDFFAANVESEQPVFSMVLPPPNVTGSLHMGHALNSTLQDILARWKRMQGRNVLWVPGTDHAGIATQNVIERQLAEQGKHRTDLGRERFEALAWEWKEQAEANILQQIRRLGCSCDWSRKRFTLDQGLSRAVREVFVRLYEDGLIYQGEYLVNWCPRCGTAISDLEVEHEPAEGNLWYIRYPVKDSPESIVVATTRPETMLGDTGVAFHPDDERYRRLRGKTVILPLMDREIPVILDNFVDSEFGTGAVKVTPGHDPADFEAGRRHGLAIVRVIGEDGSMTAEAGPYAGLDRYEARQRVVEDLRDRELLVKIERHGHSIGHCQRCQTVVEPLVSKQWFVRVKPLAEQAIRAVEEGKTVFVPANYEKVYFEWMNNIHDWCISRQLWWGHRIPAWNCQDCSQITVSREDPEKCSKCGSSSIIQETDVLDTWFSSGLWPFSTLGWPDKTRELEVYYPTSIMVTGFDIIFFWVARMMMMGLRFMNDVPFGQVFINGLVRDEDGHKMSKSRGNIIDPLEIIDQYGTDAVRFTLSVMAVPGADIPFSVSRMAGYRAFCNKIWNAARFLLMNLDLTEPVPEAEIEELRQSRTLALEDRWILSRLHQVIGETNRDLEKFNVHEASNSLYHFFWHELCDWYIELIKADVTAGVSERGAAAQKVAAYVLETSLRLLHPFIPFITEELWQKVPHEGVSIMLSRFPEARQDWVDAEVCNRMERLQELITSMRTARAENNVDPRYKVKILLRCNSDSKAFLESQLHHLERLVQSEKIEFGAEPPPDHFQIHGVAGLCEYFIDLEGLVDIEAEQQRLTKELQRLQSELQKLEHKLANDKFRQKAPREVVEKSQCRHREVIERIERITQRLDSFPSP